MSEKAEKVEEVIKAKLKTPTSVLLRGKGRF